MASPRPYVVAASGDAQDAPPGAVPIDLYGAGGGGGVALPIESLDVNVAEDAVNGIAADDLQAVLSGLAARIKVLEDAQ